MLKDKRGLSAIVMTIIMIGLVLVAVGIVWVVVLNILEGQSESLEYNQACLGISLEINNLVCDATNCSFVVKRKSGSTGSPIDGLAITFSSASESGQETTLEGNVAATLTKSGIAHGIAPQPTTVEARIYFNKTEGGLHYCSQKVLLE